jgi:hypothetical protein
LELTSEKGLFVYTKAKEQEWIKFQRLKQPLAY